MFLWDFQANNFGVQNVKKKQEKANGRRRYLECYNLIINFVLLNYYFFGKKVKAKQKIGNMLLREKMKM